MYLPKVSGDKTPLSPYDPPCIREFDALFSEIFAKTSHDQISTSSFFHKVSDELQ